MAHAAIKMTTALATGLLATAATSFTADSPPRELAIPVRPLVQTSSPLNVVAPATPNNLLAAALESPTDGDSTNLASFATAPNAGVVVARERSLFAANPIHSTTAPTGSSRFRSMPDTALR